MIGIHNLCNADMISRYRINIFLYMGDNGNFDDKL